MKHIEIAGLGVHVEIYKRNDKLTDLETVKEAIKTLQREVLRVESKLNTGIGRQSNSDEL